MLSFEIGKSCKQEVEGQVSRVDLSVKKVKQVWLEKWKSFLKIFYHFIFYLDAFQVISFVAIGIN